MMHRKKFLLVAKVFCYIVGLSLCFAIIQRSAEFLLIGASTGGAENTVRILLKFGTDPNVPHIDEGNALIGAAYNSHVSIVRDLIRAGANPNSATNLGESALMDAAQHGNTDVVNTLLNAGADPRREDGAGHTALTYADGRHAITVILKNAMAYRTGSPIHVVVHPIEH